MDACQPLRDNLDGVRLITCDLFSVHIWYNKDYYRVLRVPSWDVPSGTGEAVVVFFCPRRPGGRDGTAAHCMVMAGRISFGSITLWSLAESQESPSVAALRARTRRTRTRTRARRRAEPPPPPTYYPAYTLRALVSFKNTLYKDTRILYIPKYHELILSSCSGLPMYKHICDFYINVTYWYRYDPFTGM